MKSWGCGCAAFIRFCCAALRGGRRVFRVRAVRGNCSLTLLTDRVPPILYAGPRPPSLLGRT